MKGANIEREKLDQGGLSHLEDDLRTLFQPVKPRPSYISESKMRLINVTQQKRSWLAVLQLIFTALVFVASLVFFLVMSIRTVINLLSTLGLIRLVKEEARRKRAILTVGAPVIPAPTGELLR